MKTFLVLFVCGFNEMALRQIECDKILKDK